MKIEKYVHARIKRMEKRIDLGAVVDLLTIFQDQLDRAQANAKDKAMASRRLDLIIVLSEAIEYVEALIDKGVEK